MSHVKLCFRIVKRVSHLFLHLAVIWLLCGLINLLVDNCLREKFREDAGIFCDLVCSACSLHNADESASCSHGIPQRVRLSMHNKIKVTIEIRIGGIYSETAL